jgi:hypothetical protein
MDRNAKACPYSEAEIKRSQRFLAALLGEPQTKGVRSDD